MNQPLSNAVRELVTLARQGRKATLAGKLTAFLMHFEDVLATLPPEQQQALMAPIPKLLRLQQVEDWVGFADVLEYDLLTRI